MFLYLDSRLFYMLIILSPVPSARILGGPDLHVDIGSTINLTCLIQFSPEPPAYIFWYHEDEVSGQKVIMTKLFITFSARRFFNGQS